ncbi:hypothetical protein [Endozoicomonas elysicola]|uniref:HTH cro/C1-type domain-containing protein n=1 Tax=Endozoicomonas elysicola TaxID=305900 RepID=A0A081K5R8_9GAMM|nr:hypothetical protein [Endozoicomonas elysicola]KEI69494.1 hypothetical protein GV64_00950 [Endozoicomonas elysicola]
MSLSDNLRYLCSEYSSIAEVCRCIPFNRQQFNRYLSGENRPRGQNIRRLCEFFGITETVLLMPHEQFLQNYKRKSPAVEFNSVLSSFQTFSQQSSPQLEKYLGYYFQYYYSMSSPRHILKGLVRLEEKENIVCYERIERLEETLHRKPVNYCLYKGLAILRNDRLFLLDYESVTGNEIVETILYPSFKHRVDLLEGTMLGVSATRKREPMVRSVVWEYLGKKIPFRKSLKSCRLYQPDSSEIPAGILQKLETPESTQH